MSDAGGLQITQWDCWKVAGKRPLNDTLTFWWCSDWLSNATAVITVRHGIDHLAGCAPNWGGGGGALAGSQPPQLECRVRLLSTTRKLEQRDPAGMPHPLPHGKPYYEYEWLYP